MEVAVHQRRPVRLERVVGVAGLVFLPLVFGPVLWASSAGEPDFQGRPEDIQRFFAETEAALAGVGGFLRAVGMVAFIWFAVGLAVLLARAEGALPWRSAVAAASSVAFVAVGLNGYWSSAAYRGDLLGPQVQTYAFDLGNLEFANSWVALGSFAACAGWVTLETGLTARWLGWTAVAAGVGLVLSRAVWTTQVWFLPYAVFWVWFVAVCVGLLRGRIPRVPA